MPQIMTKKIYSFTNEPFTNFNVEENKTKMLHSLNKIEGQLGKDCPIVINGQKIYQPIQKTMKSINPAKKDEVVGIVSMADKDLAEKAHRSAQQAFLAWKKTSVEERASVLMKAASLLRERKYDFCAWMIYEAGKNWTEADADIGEAIDFMEYYARQMLDMSNPDPLISINQNVDTTKYIQLPKEDNFLRYIPLGVGICLPPWNFPVAILSGMTTSAIVTGNTLVLKPSERTSVIAYHFCCLLEEAGLPKGVVNYLPGYGSEIGDYLVDHPKTRFITFTGSKKVGLRIFERASIIQTGQKWMKKVIAELGGKDGIVVDETADLDRAARDIVVSAFGFQGQKCSAGSRAIIVESVYDEVKEKVVELTKNLKIGPPSENYPVGPVCDVVAYRTILDYIQIGKQEGTLLTGGNSVREDEGYYIEPTIFEGIESRHRLFQEEIFGPVLTLTKSKDWENAIELYNDTEYGLTGSFHSTDKKRIEEAYDRMHCGNVYINKKCTGALVGVHPFGGFNMSGTDSKAGGPDYLLHFTQPKAITRLVD